MHQSIPTPSSSAFHFGGVTLHFYAIAILIGILTALQWARIRAKNAGIDEEIIFDLAAYVIPAGIIGGRLYHVITSPSRYFGADGNVFAIFKVWEGGMGIWGAIALGSCAACFRLRRLKIPFAIIADVIAPTLLIGQAVGRWGNWFNGELFGSPTSLPWALSIPQSLRPEGYISFETFHPIFLYESLWCALGALLIARVTTRVAGSRFLIYIVWYCTGRTFLETLRIDTSTLLFGMRLNFWVSLLLLFISGVYLIRRERTSR